MKWHDALAKKITVDEYYIHWGGMQFKVRYVTHNGFTYIESLPDSKRSRDFEEWLHLRSDLNTRYDRPHHWQPIIFNRDKKIVEWAVKAVEEAYNQYHQTNIKVKRKE